MPCKRGSSCVFDRTVKDNYTCSCTSLSFGKNCEFYIDKYTQSSILNWKQMRNLKTLIGFPLNLDLKLIFQATRHGFNTKFFHPRVDGKFGTLMLIKTNESFIFGGYTEANSMVVSSWNLNKNVFVFSLVNPSGTPLKINVAQWDSSILSTNFDYPLQNLIYTVAAKYDSQNFLAGSDPFEIFDIEVYKVDCKILLLFSLKI